MEKPVRVDSNDGVFVTVQKAIQEKKEWIRKVQTRQISYTKGKRIA
jgi:hypothetical protein